MSDHKIFSMGFSKKYSLDVQKAERKSRTGEEVIQIICWFTGFNSDGLRRQVGGDNDLATFFAEAPTFNPNVSFIKGVVCGVRVDDAEDTQMPNIDTSIN